MWEDPIVNEVRKVREEIARQSNYDLHTYFENLRKNSKNRGSEDEKSTICISRCSKKCIF